MLEIKTMVKKPFQNKEEAIVDRMPISEISLMWLFEF